MDTSKITSDFIEEIEFYFDFCCEGNFRVEALKESKNPETLFRDNLTCFLRLNYGTIKNEQRVEVAKLKVDPKQHTDTWKYDIIAKLNKEAKLYALVELKYDEIEDPNNPVSNKHIQDLYGRDVFKLESIKKRIPSLVCVGVFLTNNPFHYNNLLQLSSKEYEVDYNDTKEKVKLQKDYQITWKSVSLFDDESNYKYCVVIV